MNKDAATGLAALEYAVNQLLERMNALKAENDRLKQALAEQHSISTSQQGEINQLQTEISQVKTAKLLDVASTDVKEARSRIDSLIRKVDRCISLINA